MNGHVDNLKLFGQFQCPALGDRSLPLVTWLLSPSVIKELTSWVILVYWLKSTTIADRIGKKHLVCPDFWKLYISETMFPFKTRFKLISIHSAFTFTLLSLRLTSPQECTVCIYYCTLAWDGSLWKDFMYSMHLFMTWGQYRKQGLQLSDKECTNQSDIVKLGVYWWGKNLLI
jgi:hypothetical protein